MARVKHMLSEQGCDIAHMISAGVLARACPGSLIEDILRSEGKGSRRVRLLPARVVVYFVMAMALWREAAIEEVLRVVCESAKWFSFAGEKVACAGKSAISQARSRLGAGVMQKLAEQVLRPIAQPTVPGGWYKGLRVMAVDGSSLDVADERRNAEYFGYPGRSRGDSAFPQMRVLSLVECGSHVTVGAELGPYKRSEQKMARSLFPSHLKADMLLLADRGFYSFDLWNLAGAGGARLLWRVKSNLKLPVIERLADGSYLSEIYSIRDRSRRKGEMVRVIEYQLKGKQDENPQIYRLISNLLEYEFAPAKELAALYHERWEVENVFGEIKTQLYGHRTILRSKTPELVIQEMWGLLLAHFAVRQLMYEASFRHGVDPDTLSFINAVRVIKRKMPIAAAIPP